MQDWDYCPRQNVIIVLKTRHLEGDKAMKKGLIIVLAWMVFFSGMGPSLAANGQIVAVFNVEDKGAKLTLATLDRLGDYLATLLTAHGYQVIPRSSLKARLAEQRKESYQRCYDQTCQIEIGREVAAQKMLSTRVIKLGSKCKVTMTFFDLKKATSEAGATASSDCSPDAIVESFEKAVNSLIHPEIAKTVASGPGDSDYDKLARRVELAERTEHEQTSSLRKAWTAVKKFSSLKSAKREERIAAIKKFLADFHDDNPYLAKAQLLLIKLRANTGDVLQPGTKLIWRRCPLGENWNGKTCVGRKKMLPWELAKSACPDGYRLPKRDEFLSLLDCDRKSLKSCHACEDSSYCQSMFFRDRGKYWAAEKVSQNKAWLVGFDSGLSVVFDQNVPIYVRCVMSDTDK